MNSESEKFKIMKNILVLVAHPNYKESKANKALVEAARKVRNVVIKDIYAEPFTVDNYYDAVKRADIIVFQFPFYWGSAPSLLKKWTDEIFMELYENPGVSGKSLMIATTAGSELLRPYQFTALYAGMGYITPFVVYSVSAPNAEDYIKKGASEYQSVLERLTE